MKQTAVELIENFMEQNQYFIGNDLFQYFNEVKEMEKEQLEKAFKKGEENIINLIEIYETRNL